MDDVVNRIARELSDAIAAAVAEDARVEACRERARAAGFEMKVTLEAVIGFVNRQQPGRPGQGGHSAEGGQGRAAKLRDERQRPPLPSFAAHRGGRDPEQRSRVAPREPRTRERPADVSAGLFFFALVCVTPAASVGERADRRPSGSRTRRRPLDQPAVARNPQRHGLRPVRQRHRLARVRINRVLAVLLVPLRDRRVLVHVLHDLPPARPRCCTHRMRSLPSVWRTG